MSDTDREALQCQSFRAGHSVHYIQARQVARHPESRRQGHVASIAGQVVEFALNDGGVVQLRTHDAVRVERLVAECGSRAEYHPRWGLLDFHMPHGIAHISVSTNADIGPCQRAAEGGMLMRPDDEEDRAAFTARFIASFADRSQDG